MYGAILTTNYGLLATVVRESLQGGAAEGPSWLVIDSPATVTGALEGIGYGFMSLAVLFIGFAFDTATRRSAWARWLLVANGVGGLAGVVVLGIGSALPAALQTRVLRRDSGAIPGQHEGAPSGVLPPTCLRRRRTG
jgi:hypothetical protein